MEQNETDPSREADDDTPGLTDNQVAALPYLVASPTLAEGARLADIGRTTLYRWMNDDGFRTTLEQLRSEAADLAHNELQGLMLKGALVLAEAMEDASPHVRVRAAHAALSIGLKAVDLKELRQRLERLDDAFSLWSRRNMLR